MLWREGRSGLASGTSEELPAHQPPAPPRPSPADHVAKGHGGQKQAQDEHQLEEEGGAGGTESSVGHPGVLEEGVLGSDSSAGVSLASNAKAPEARGGGAEQGRRQEQDASPTQLQPCAPPQPGSLHLLDVEGEEDEDAVEQGQQRAVEETHPGDRLRRHYVQHVLGHQELLPAQPGPEPA